MSESWLVKEFQDLTLQELYEMLRLRNEVFVVEQKCVFQDADAKDYVSIHIMCWSHYENENRKLIGYIRLLPAGVSYYDGFASIGRLVTHSSVRKTGLGKRLVARSLEELVKRFGDNGKKIRIGAQLYLKKFYEDFGFEQTSEPYDEDGICHIEMTKIFL